MNDYKNIITANAEPEAESMIQTLRAIGYSIESAIADIIDNSIDAGAKNIWIDYVWRGADTTISITDDGFGMFDSEIIQAMRPGSINPLIERNSENLGRFGLGLKTASFSQCRKFCVISKKEGIENYWSWDLDYVHTVKSWKLIKHCPSNYNDHNRLKENKSGTVVLWWDIDRLTKHSVQDKEESKSDFMKIMDNVRNHLSMVFHRYIEEGLCLWLQDRKIDPWDPFMLGYDGLQTRPDAILQDGNIIVKGFVLPHRSKLTQNEYEYGKGPKENWTSHQGFYIYRSKRLIVAGDWLGLFKREVHYDLCRIKIDIKNTLDFEWQIDIKKSVARPPANIKNHLISIAKEVRALGVEVYRHRGKIIKRDILKNEYCPIWLEKVKHGKRFYNINRDHPIISGLLRDGKELKQTIDNSLRFIEETVPIPLITYQENENEIPNGKPFEGTNIEILVNVMKDMYKKLIDEGWDKDCAKKRIYSIEPFDAYVEFLEIL